MSLPPAIRRAQSHHAGTTGRFIGSAFADDPVSRWSFGNAEGIARAYAHLARHLYVPRDWSFVAGDVGAALWLPPGSAPRLPLRRQLAMAWDLAVSAGPVSIARALRADQCMRAHHPQEPHCYLFAIGVQPAGRGRGIASALLRAVLDRADAESQPAYLENTNPTNTGLYERFGFRGDVPFSPAPGCPPLTPMWREPRPRG